MSRVDDDSQERRVQERLLLEKQRLEQKTKDTKFSKLVHKSGAERTKAEDAQRVATGTTGRDVIEQARGFNSRLLNKGGEQAGSQQRTADSDGAASAGAASQGEVLADRHEGTRTTEERLDERKESSDRSAAAHLGVREKDDARADSGGAGANTGGGSQKGDDGSEAAAANAFRLNPALMAPVAVAQPRTGMMSDKLRALANEIAQKIVQNVRVGTNRAGEAEFQIDLKSSVLAGLQIKISSRHGKITCVFSGKDQEVLKLIKQNGDGLKKALQGRGLVLAELKIEERK